MMNNKNNFRQWFPEDGEHFIQQYVSQYYKMSFDEMESKALALVNAHEQSMDQQSVVLYVGTNVINPKAAKIISSSIGSIGSMASLGYPRAK